MEDNSKISPDKIAAIIVDHKNDKNMIVTKELVVNQLKIVCPEIAKSFDETFIEEFQNLSSDLSEILSIISTGYIHAQGNNNELYIRCGDLLRNSANTIMASIQILRSGFRFQSITLLRGAIETCATILHLLIKPEIIEDFLKDRLQSSKSISFVDKQIPLFGQIWGILSQKHIHITSVHAAFYPLRNFNDRNEENALAALGTLGITTKILAITTELTFFQELLTSNYWEQVEPGKFKFIGLKKIESAWFNKIFILKNGATSRQQNNKNQ